jgi:hypothetical protein
VQFDYIKSGMEDGDDDFPDEEVIKPPKSVFGKLKPTGVGPGASPAARKRRSLALKKAVSKQNGYFFSIFMFSILYYHYFIIGSRTR